MAPGLSIAIAEKQFGAGALLFADFRLDIAPGSVVALMGPSGIGKSSLLRMIAGIDRDFSGTIRVGGVNAPDAPMAGFVFQDPRLLPWLTALDNIRLADPAMAIRQAEALLADMGLAGRGNDFPAQLSGGMQRRVALARALVSNPGLLLLDEPFVSLDRMLAGEMQTLLAGLIERHDTSVLLATHEPDDAARLADRVIVLGGRPAEIVADLRLDIAAKARGPQQVADYLAQVALATGGAIRA